MLAWCVRMCTGIAQKMDNGRLYVYHFRGDVDKCLREECANRHDGRSCYSVGARSGQSAVVFSCVDCFAKGHCLHVHSYGVHPREYNRERPGEVPTELSINFQSSCIHESRHCAVMHSIHTWSSHCPSRVHLCLGSKSISGRL